jgi:hypothetical protein
MNDRFTVIGKKDYGMSEMPRSQLLILPKYSAIKEQ